MTMFHFPTQNDASRDLVEWVKRWLANLPRVEWVQDVQDDPAFYKRGDLFYQEIGRFPRYMELKAEVGYTAELELPDKRRTPNLAIERFSNYETRTPGGPWFTQAHYYAHIYADGVLVLMDTQQLLRWLREELNRAPDVFQHRLISNEGDGRTWTTYTYLVPRDRVRASIKDCWQVMLR
jgi:hypothetical protein